MNISDKNPNDDFIIDDLASEIEQEAADENQRLSSGKGKRDGKPKPACSREKKPFSRKIKAAPPYPVEALGDNLCGVTKAIAAITRAPMAACALAVLAAANAAVQGLANIRMPHGLRPIVLFVLIIQMSGERKSGIFEWAFKALFEYQAKLWRAHEAIAKASPNGDAGDPPAFFIGECTVDGLMKALVTSRGTAIVASEEGATFTQGHSFSGNDFLRTAALYSVLWDARTLYMARAATKSRTIEGKRAAICLMAQYKAIAAFISNAELKAQGLLARFLMCASESLVGTRLLEGHIVPQETYDTVDAFHEQITSILELPLPLAAGTDNVLAPRDLGLSEQAHRYYVSFHDEIEVQLPEGGKYHPVCEFGAKAADHALRVAGTVTLFKNPQAKVIGGKTMRNAIEVIRFHLGEALRLVNAEGDNDLFVAEKTLNWIQRKNLQIVSLSELYRLGPTAIRNAAYARKIAAILVDHGYLEPIEGGAMIKGKLCEAFRVL